jgi:hypothetical protein
MGASGASDGSSNLPRATKTRFRMLSASVYVKFIVLSSNFLAILGFTSLGKRKCVGCGAELTDEDVMKVIFEDGSCEVFPLSTCPECLKKELAKKARR